MISGIRITAVLASAALLLCVLGGCQSNESSTAPDTAQTDQSIATSAAEQSPAQTGLTNGTTPAQSISSDAASDTQTKQAGESDTPAASVTPAAAEPSAGETNAPQTQTQPAQQPQSQTAVQADSVSAKAGEKSVAFSVKITNNPGFNVCGIRLTYDAALSPVTAGSGQSFDCYFENGTVTDSMIATCMFNADERLLAYAAFGMEDHSGDGTVFTVYFDVPSNAKAGDVFPVQCEVVDLLNAEGSSVSAKAAGGSITVTAE